MVHYFRKWRRLRDIAFAGSFILTGSWSFAFNVEEEGDFPGPRELRMLSIEELVNIEITTVTRRVERVQVTPSAIAVLTDEDIRRSGAPTIPDALRFLPGVHVGRVVTDNNNTWAVGVRGLNSTLNNKLLVMRDGRSLYSPLFSGVFWDVQETLMEDIDRIEVVRGPGGTMWGGNAVNGVINIVTKNARDTQGLLLSGRAGDRERGMASVRYGGEGGENTWYRVYARASERQDLVFDGSRANERQQFGLGGFRVDSTPATDIHWTLQGEAYDSRIGLPDQRKIEANGSHLMGTWIHSYDEGRHVRIQTYYDRTERDIPDGIREKRDTGKFEIETRFPLGERHDFLAGITANISHDRIDNTEGFAFVPESSTVRNYGVFVQDRITLIPEELHFTLGSKFEHNSYSGFEHQPSARVGWAVSEPHFLWASASRAVRTPARIDTDFRIFDEGGPLLLHGNPDFDSERLIAYETGYRVRLLEPLTLSLSLFYNDYDHLRSIEQANPPDPVPLTIGNRWEGQTYGFEVGSTWQATDWQRFRTSYSNLQKSLRLKSGSTADPDSAEGDDPEHMFTLHSTTDIGRNWTFDGAIRYVSALPGPEIPSYTEIDLRLGWFWNENLEVSLVGRNLLEGHHREFGTTNYAVPRSVFFQVQWDL